MRIAKPVADARPLFIALALAGSLTACSTTTAAPKTTAEEATPHIAMGCLAANANWAIGKTVDDALLAKVKTDAKAQSVRVINPGTAVTMEYNGGRLNLHIDRKGLIERVNCG